MAHAAEVMCSFRRQKIFRFARVHYELISKRFFDGAQSILDCGCGDGAFCAVNPSAIGLDIHRSSKFEGFNFIQGTVEKIPLPDNTLDGVFCAHVLEHLTDPTLAIKEMYRVLKPGGKLFIIVPSYWTLFLPFSRYNFFAEPTHVRPFTPFSMETLLKWYDFKVQKIGYNIFYFPFVRYFFRKINKPGWYKSFVSKFSCPFPPFELYAYAVK